MSEDRAEYKPGEPVEAEVDHYRNRLRTLRVWLRDLAMEGEPFPSMESRLEPLRALVDDLLSRPRSNSPAIDGLEREVARLRAKLIDADLEALDMRHAKQVNEQLSREVEELRKDLGRHTANMGAVEELVYKTAGRAAMRVDRLLEKARERWG